MSEINHNAPSGPQLSPEDQRLLDCLIDAGFDFDQMGPLSSTERMRVQQLQKLLGLMCDYPVDDADEALLDATMARIDRYEDQRATRMSLSPEDQPMRGGISFRLPDFISVAAVLLIAASILWPLLASVRQQSIDRTCANNMRMVGYAFGHYAADNNGAMPMAKAGFLPGASWDTMSNVVNLAPLVEGQYCSHGHLNCAGNHEHLENTYSYQWQKPGTQMMWGSGRVTIVLGDRNPLIDAARAGRILPPDTLSRDHRGRGQNVLATDGATFWLTDTVIGTRDNIWLPHGAQKLSAGATPKDKADVMLAH